MRVAGGAHDGDLLARLGHKVDVVHERLFGRVAEANVLEGHAAGAGTRQLGGVGGVGHDLVGLEQVEHALGGGERALKHVHGHRKLREGLVGRRHELEERLEHADRDLPGDEHAAGKKPAGHHGEAPEQADGRADGLREEVGKRTRIGELVGGGAYLGGARAVAAEGLDHEAAGVGLLDLAGKAPEGGLALGVGIERAGGRQAREHERGQ